MHNVEYEIREGGIPTSTAHLNNHDAPCAVCYVATCETVLMVPGRYTCPPNWTKEYYGYLMTEHSHAVHMRTTFECVDVNAEVVAGCQTVKVELVSIMWSHVVDVCLALHMTNRKR